MENIVLQSLRAGQLASLEDELVLSDPTLAKWADNLIGICKLLTKRNMNHVLLQFQIFIKVSAAAITSQMGITQPKQFWSLSIRSSKHNNKFQVQRTGIKMLERIIK